MICEDCTKHKICKSKYELDKFLNVFSWFAATTVSMRDIQEIVTNGCSEVDPIKD